MTLRCLYVATLFVQWWNQLSRFQRSVAYMLTLAALLTVLYFLPGTHAIWNPGSGKLNTPLDNNYMPSPLSLFFNKKVLLLSNNRI
jgi:hypothetical protein